MDLGLSDAEFWPLNPALFDALQDRWYREQREQDYRAGVIAALVANSIPTQKKRKATKPADFFPRLKKGGGE